MSEKWIRALPSSDLENGKCCLVSIEGKAVAIFNIENTYFAIEDSCTHRGGPLSEGPVKGFEVTCPWHKAKFDLRSGAVTFGPAKSPAKIYPCRLTADFIEIQIG